ncbi:MAG TPA: TraR/DksA C4-type zinc finger protein [Candidatus Babeliales bacterium]|nr:TraR/DksA C4-type zinc finger protein [Candidatus Babeliales bacterium]
MTENLSSKKRDKLLELAKQELLKRKQELELELEELSYEKFSDDQIKDPGDEAVSSAMDALRESLKETEHEEYNRIKKALEMIENGTYGICIDCEQPIKEKRLQYYPNATRCLICQERFEL